MKRFREIAGNGRRAGLGPSIFRSAAGHLLLLLAMLLLHPGAPVLSLPGAVEVLLVSARGRPAGDGSPGPMPVRRGKAAGAEEDASGARPVRPSVLPPADADRPDVGADAPAPAPPAVRPPAPAEPSPIRDPAASVPPPADPVPSGRAAPSTAEQDPGPATGEAGTSTGGGASGTRVGGPAAETADVAPAGPGWPLAVLRARIQERIIYPAEAVRRGQEGEVLLRIRIGIGGVPREIRVTRSSGARILDEAARRGVVRAAPLPSGPGWFEIPVRFSLR